MFNNNNNNYGNNFYSKLSESLTSSEVNNFEFNIKSANKNQIF